MKTREDLSDGFLKEVTEILDLDNFRFTKSTIGTRVEATDTQKTELRVLCKKNKNERTLFNETSVLNKMNIDWATDVIYKYFKIYL